MPQPECILVTGGSSGVGLSVVQHLRKQYEVIALSRRIPTTLAECDNVHCYSVDLADSTALADTLSTLSRVHNRILYIVNNAGVMDSGPTNEIDLNKVTRAFAVNVLAPLQIMQWGLPHMAATGFGRIVNVTSGAAFNCSPGYAAYSSSKAALNAMTLTAAKEYENSGICINLMSPGPVRSEMAPDAKLDPNVCHPTLDYLLSRDTLVTGGLFWLGYQLPTIPDLDGVDWAKGTATAGFKSILPESNQS